MNSDTKIDGLQLIFWTTLLVAGIIAGNVYYWKRDGLAEVWKSNLRGVAPFVLVVFPSAFTYFFLIGTLSIVWVVIAAIAAALLGWDQNQLTLQGCHVVEWLCGLVCLPLFYRLFTWLRLGRCWHWMLLFSFMFVAGYRDVRGHDITPDSTGPYIRMVFQWTDAIAALVAFVLCWLIESKTQSATANHAPAP